MGIYTTFVEHNKNITPRNKDHVHINNPGECIQIFQNFPNIMFVIVTKTELRRFSIDILNNKIKITYT